MKRVLSLVATVLLALGAFAQNETGTTPYAFVNTSGVNLRNEPSTTSSVGTKANVGDVYRVLEVNGDWIQVEVCDGPDSNYYWISSRFVDILNHKDLPENKLDAMFSFERGTDTGMLVLEKKGKDANDNTVVTYSYLIAKDGNDAAPVLNKSGECLYLWTGTLLPPEGWEDSPILYDEGKGLLYFCGILWKEQQQ